MCLAIPARVLSIDVDRTAVIDLAGVTRETNLTLVPEARVGDFVLIHAGYAIQRLDEDEARETLDLLAQIAELGDEGGCEARTEGRA